MAGLRLASTDGEGWTVETVELDLTGRRRTGQRVSTEPLGDGPQLVVSRNGHRVGYAAGLEDLIDLGIDLSRMEVVERWLGPPKVGRAGYLISRNRTIALSQIFRYLGQRPPGLGGAAIARLVTHPQDRRRWPAAVSRETDTS